VTDEPVNPDPLDPVDPPQDPPSEADMETLAPSHQAPANIPDGILPMPETIGPYRIIGVIGQGGFGAVYEAAQDNPRRKVALKVIRADRASRESIRRFEFEVETLAKLRHIGIAQIYEAGTYDSAVGTCPYFAMEYIPGAKPITQYCDEHQLDIEERLRMFQIVCDAVHHGHQRGVIHRDLKPDNILIDAAGNPKVIDFGVARATDADLSAATMQTNIGQIIGTLQYMSPEQCTGDRGDVDTRADVYSLGIILYELLCHELPYDVAQQALIEAIRVIREQAPKRPSTITSLIRGDLETITLKALEKNADRRYASADGLGKDLERYLNHDPIEARKPSLGYQAKLFAQRHRLAVGAGAALILTITAGLIATSLLWTESVALNRQLETANVEVTQQRDLATDRLQQSKDLHRSQLRDTFHAVRRLEGALPEKIRLAQQVADFFTARRDAGEADLEDLQTLADSHFEIADILGGTLQGNVGEAEEALAAIRTARALWIEVAAAMPNDSGPQVKVAIMLRREARLHQAADRPHEAISALTAVATRLEGIAPDDKNAIGAGRTAALALLDAGDIRDGLGDHTLAQSTWGRGLQQLAELAARAPDNPRVQADHAHALRRVGTAEVDSDLDTALRHMVSSRDIFQQRHDVDPTHDLAHRDLGWSHYYVGWVAAQQPDRDLALQSLDDGWRIVIVRCSHNPDDALARKDVMHYLSALVELHRALEAMDLVPERARHGALVLQPVVEVNPDNTALTEVLRNIIEAGRPAP